MEATYIETGKGWAPGWANRAKEVDKLQAAQNRKQLTGQVHGKPEEMGQNWGELKTSGVERGDKKGCEWKHIYNNRGDQSREIEDKQIRKIRATQLYQKTKISLNTLRWTWPLHNLCL